MNLRLFMPYPKLRLSFENICFKIMLFSAENKTKLVGSLSTIIGAKLCHASFQG